MNKYNNVSCLYKRSCFLTFNTFYVPCCMVSKINLLYNFHVPFLKFLLLKCHKLLRLLPVTNKNCTDLLKARLVHGMGSVNSLPGGLYCIGKR